MIYFKKNNEHDFLWPFTFAIVSSLLLFSHNAKNDLKKILKFIHRIIK